MANRTGTYVAFDGLGETDPTKSDFKYYATIQAWDTNKNTEFRYVDSHEKTYAVRDSSKRTTLEARIRERLSASKNMIVILSSKTRKSGSMLSYEIEQAVDKYELPLIIAHTGYEVIADPSLLSLRWPTALKTRIDNDEAKAIHIPFIKDALFDAISQFTVSNLPSGPLNYYSKKAHIEFDVLEENSIFSNRAKI